MKSICFVCSSVCLSVCFSVRRFVSQSTPQFIRLTVQNLFTSPSVFRCDYAMRCITGRVRPSVRPSIPCDFCMTNMDIFLGEKSSNDIINYDTMSDDEVVRSDVRSRYLFLLCTLIPFTLCTTTSLTGKIT